MSLNIKIPENEENLKPRITVYGVGGAGGNAVNNMIRSNLEGVEFVVANTDSQALNMSLAERRIQLGLGVTRGLGAGSNPNVGADSAEENMEEIVSHLQGSNMVFVTAGMGGGTGSGAAPVIARAAREQGVLTVGVVTKPFHFEGKHRMEIADRALEELAQYVDTLIVIPNQNLFRVANEKTTFAEAFKLADDVLHAGVRGVTDLMVMPGLINLDFADIRSVMSEMGKAMMGTGEADGDSRSIAAAEAAISNPLLDDVSMKGAKGVLINVTGGMDMTLFEVDEAANRIRDEVDPNANIIFGSTFDENLEGKMRISVVATGIESESYVAPKPVDQKTPAPAVSGAHNNPAQYPNTQATQRSPGGSNGYTGRPAQPEYKPSYPFAAQQPPTQPAPAPANDVAASSPSAAPVAPETASPAASDSSSGHFVPGRAVSAEEMERSPAASNAAPENSSGAEPFAAAAISNAKENASGTQPSVFAEETAPDTERAGSPSLFERFTGFGSKKKQTQSAAEDYVENFEEAANEPSPKLPSNEDDGDIQPTLNSLTEAPAAAEEEEDNLDIPAFLRRQV